MEKKEIDLMVEQISDYILGEVFEKHDPDIPAALTVICEVVRQIIEATCSTMDLDAEQMIDTFCNALQMMKKESRTYTTGDDDCDKLMMEMVKELKNGGDINDIVDRYVMCETDDIRNEIIEKLKAVVREGNIDNVNIGYEHEGE